MSTLTKTLIALIFAAGAFGGAQASAEYRPDRCSIDHDHRSHNASYYKYYPKDDNYRAGAYQSRRGDRGYDDRRYDDRGYDNRRGYNNRRGYRPRSRVVDRTTLNTRWRARIVVVEEIYYTRSGREQLVCSVLAKGPEAYYVPPRSCGAPLIAIARAMRAFNIYPIR